MEDTDSKSPGNQPPQQSTKVSSFTSISSQKTKVNILIRSSSQHYSDFSIECDLLWTVRQLKMNLSLVHPGKPSVGEQKLIYSGRLLSDSAKLKEFLRNRNNVFQENYIIHLVYLSKNLAENKPKPLTATPAKTLSGSRASNETSCPCQAASQSSVETSSANNQANTSSPQAAAESQSNQLPTGVEGNFFAPSPLQQMQHMQNLQMNYAYQQILQYNGWLRQVYVRYMEQMLQRLAPDQLENLRDSFMAVMNDNSFQTCPVMAPPNFYQYAAAGVFQPPMQLSTPQCESIFSLPSTAVNSQPTAAAPPRAEVIQNQPAARINLRRFANMQRNNQNNHRDLFDTLLSIVQMGTLGIVLYMNTTPARCLGVMLIAAVIYTYQCLVVRNRRNRRNNNRVRNWILIRIRERIRNLPRIPVPEVNEANLHHRIEEVRAIAQALNQRMDNIGRYADENNNNPGPAEAPNNEERNRSFFSNILHSVIIPFFVSLLPETPAG